MYIKYLSDGNKFYKIHRNRHYDRQTDELYYNYLRMTITLCVSVCLLTLY